MIDSDKCALILDGMTRLDAKIALVRRQISVLALYDETGHSLDDTYSAFRHLRTRRGLVMQSLDEALDVLKDAEGD